MTATVEPRVEIDDRIREQPSLLDAVTSATAYLGRHLDGVPMPAIIRWEFAPLDPKTLELSISDSPDGTEPVAKRRIATAQMNDPYQREVFTLLVFSGLLGKRSELHQARIAELVSNIDFEAYAEAYQNALKATALK